MKRGSIFLLGFLIVSLFLPLYQIPEVKANPTYEDFLEFTEVDVPGDHIQRTGDPSYHIDHEAWYNEVVRLWKDYGVGDFGSNLEHLLDIRQVDFSGTTNGAWCWVLSNTNSDYLANRPLITIMLYWHGETGPAIYLREHTVGGTNQDSYDSDVNVWKYLRIKKVVTALTCKIYDTAASRDAESADEHLLDTLSITLDEDYSFRYLLTAQSYDGAVAAWQNIDIENLDLQEALAEYTEEFTETTSITASLYLWKALSEKYSETMIVTATSHGWREKATFYTETTTTTTQLNKWNELKRYFTETISVDASLSLWKAKQFITQETVNAVANFYDWIELKITMIEFIDTIEFDAIMDLTIAIPLTIEGVYALAAIAFIIAIAALVLVVTKD